MENGRPRKSPHPGVKLIRRRRSNGLLTHYGRVLQADGGWRDTNLEKEGIVTERQRRLWAERQSNAIFAIRRAHALGTAPPARTRPRAAGESYLVSRRREVAPGTLPGYELATQRFVDWLEQHKVVATELITRAHLFAYRAHLASETFDFEGSTLATKLKQTRTLLGWWRQGELVPQLTKDAIADALKSPEIERSLPVCFRSAELRAILDAAIALGWEAGATIALFLLLGLRYSELASLEWAQVDLDAPPKGELRIGPQGRARSGRGRSKTKRGRIVDLAVCPLAADLLRALPRRAIRACPWMIDHHTTTRGICFPTREAPGVPVEWSWKDLRSTCSSYLTCAPRIFGAASAFLSAKQLGHSVSVAESVYAGTLRGLPESTTLEEVMGVKDLIERIVALAKAAPRPL